MSEGSYVLGECDSWEGLGKDVVKEDVVWPLCVSEEVVTNDPGDGAIECVSDPEGWEERLGEGVGSSNPGIGAF